MRTTQIFKPPLTIKSPFFVRQDLKMAPRSSSHTLLQKIVYGTQNSLVFEYPRSFCIGNRVNELFCATILNPINSLSCQSTFYFYDIAAAVTLLNWKLLFASFSANPFLENTFHSNVYSCKLLYKKTNFLNGNICILYNKLFRFWFMLLQLTHDLTQWFPIMG